MTQFDRVYEGCGTKTLCGKVFDVLDGGLHYNEFCFPRDLMMKGVFNKALSTISDRRDAGIDEREFRRHFGVNYQLMLNVDEYEYEMTRMSFLRSANELTELLAAHIVKEFSKDMVYNLFDILNISTTEWTIDNNTRSLSKAYLRFQETLTVTFTLAVQRSLELTKELQDILQDLFPPIVFAMWKTYQGMNVILKTCDFITNNLACRQLKQSIEELLHRHCYGEGRVLNKNSKQVIVGASKQFMREFIPPALELIQMFLRAP
jgi:hypothetical protein